ncbi:MAG: class 1 fructose-bisphosphatase [Planctomycetota bacterium]|nr:MAG: class 1 fructose-bisphosphatase [Planctomycetota bacterium]
MSKLSTISLERHILETQKAYPEARGSFTILLSQIALAAKVISSEVRQAGLVDVLGLTGDENVHGEAVQKLDELANNTLIKVMRRCGQLCVMVSEEMEDPVEIPEGYAGKYVLAFDPLDGSSNIDVNASIGTIFSIYRKISDSEKGNMVDILQKGAKQLCAGYIIYGSSTVFVYTTGQGVNGFTLDPEVGAFFLSHPNIQIPEKGSIYSVNEGNYKYWDPSIQRYVDYIKGLTGELEKPYSARYGGTLVSDFHRILLKGGIFMYPADRKNPKYPQGKLRLLYECSPLAFIVEQAGGKASDGQNPIMNLQPTHLHQRTPLFIGSKECVEEVEQFIQGKRGKEKEDETSLSK